MKTGIKLIFTLFPVLFLACEKGSTHQDEFLSDNQTGIVEQNLAFIDQFYQSGGGAIIEPKPVDLNDLIVQLENVSLIEKKTVSEIPNLFLSFLKNKDPDFSMANPGEDWYAGCSRTPVINFDDNTTEYLPTSQLVYFGLYEDIALMAYYEGGIGQHETIVIFKFSDMEITEYWEGTTLNYVTNKETILAYLKNINDMNSIVARDGHQRFYW